MFIVHIISYKWDSGAPFPSFSTIAGLMGVTDTAARGYARNLEKNGYIQRVARTGQTNKILFDLLFRKLENLREKDIETR